MSLSKLTPNWKCMSIFKTLSFFIKEKKGQEQYDLQKHEGIFNNTKGLSVHENRELRAQVLHALFLKIPKCLYYADDIRK